MSGRKKLITSALTRRRVAAGGAAALVLSPFIIRPGVAQRATVNIGVIHHYLREEQRNPPPAK